MEKYTSIGRNVTAMLKNQNTVKKKCDFDSKDSNEEQYFQWYLDDLKKYGLIKKYKYHCKPYILIYPHCYYTYSATRVVKKSQKHVLTNQHTYKPDFVIDWSDNGKSRKLIKMLEEYQFTRFCYKKNIDNFFWVKYDNFNDNTLHSYIDVKPLFNKYSDRLSLFRWKRALMLEIHNIIVQAVIPEILFRNTFTPERYLYNNKNTKKRLIKWDIVTIDEFLAK
jgi:hypothetical protein